MRSHCISSCGDVSFQLIEKIERLLLWSRVVDVFVYVCPFIFCVFECVNVCNGVCARVMHISVYDYVYFYFVNKVFYYTYCISINIIDTW